MSNSKASDPKVNITVWDLPTRSFHWLLALSFAIAWITHESSRFLYAHAYGGYLFFFLLIFRFVWGSIGSRYARFRSFAYDWPSVRAYLKGLLSGQAARHIGHNPAGAWAIFIMLGLGVLVSVSGLMVLGGEENHGPLAGLVSPQTGEAAHEAHEVLTNLMLVLVFIHLGGVLVESVVHRENLIWSMITGVKEALAGTPGVRNFGLIGVALLATAVGSALYYFRGYITETPDKPFLPYQGPKLADHAVWRKTCGECHLAFHPTLLPARSWRVMMEQQHDHFGDDLDLDEPTVNDILTFMVDHAAETKVTEPAREIARTVAENEAPQRITETAFWKKEHRKVGKTYFEHKNVRSKVNCGACHFDAEAGTFEDSNMRLPR